MQVWIGIQNPEFLQLGMFRNIATVEWPKDLDHKPDGIYDAKVENKGKHIRIIRLRRRTNTKFSSLP